MKMQPMSVMQPGIWSLQGGTEVSWHGIDALSSLPWSAIMVMSSEAAFVGSGRFCTRPAPTKAQIVMAMMTSLSRQRDIPLS